MHRSVDMLVSKLREKLGDDQRSALQEWRTSRLIQAQGRAGETRLHHTNNQRICSLNNRRIRSEVAGDAGRPT